MSWWIDEPKILGSSNPTTEEIEKLYREGFRIVISLLKEDEQRPNYDPEEVRRIGFKRYSIPIKDFSGPSLDEFSEFFRIIDAALAQGKVLIHCQGGSGRTGTMGAAYWMKRGLSAREALKRIRLSYPVAVDNREQEKSLGELERHIRPLL